MSKFFKYDVGFCFVWNNDVFWINIVYIIGRVYYCVGFDFFLVVVDEDVFYDGEKLGFKICFGMEFILVGKSFECGFLEKVFCIFCVFG